MVRPSVDDDRGFAPLEMGALVVVFLLFISVVVVAGRLNVANAQVESAARTAARTISMARDPQAAVSQAEEDAAAAVGAGTSMCQTLVFDADLDDPDVVSVYVSCDVSLQQQLLSIPASVEVDQEVTEVRDRYRSDP